MKSKYIELINHMTDLFGENEIYSAGAAHLFIATPAQDDEGRVPVEIQYDEQGCYFSDGGASYVASESLIQAAKKRYKIDYSDSRRYHVPLKTNESGEVLAALSKVACFLDLCVMQDALNKIQPLEDEEPYFINSDYIALLEVEKFKDEILSNNWCMQILDEDNKMVVQTLLTDGKKNLTFDIVTKKDGYYFSIDTNYEKVKNSNLLKKAQILFGFVVNEQEGKLETRFDFLDCVSWDIDDALCIMLFASNIDLFN